MSSDLLEALKWLAGGGAAVVAAMLVSFLAERSAKFQALDRDAKLAVILGASVTIALGAWAVLTYVPPEVLAQLQSPFKIVFLAISAVLGTQVWHKLINT